MKKLLFIALTSVFFPFVALTSEKSPTTSKNLIKVAVVDTGISKQHINKLNICKLKDFTNTSINDSNGHGDHITHLISQTAAVDKSKYCFIIYKAYSTNGAFYTEALEDLVKEKPDIINISGGGFGVIPRERTAILKLLNSGTVIAAASGNDRLNLNNSCNYFPACYDKRIVVVGNKSRSSNYGNKYVDIIINGNSIDVYGKRMTGSSQSTAIFTGTLLRNLVIDRDKRG